MKSSKWMGAAVAVSLVLGLAAVAAADAEPTGGKAVKAAAGQAAPAAGKEAWAVCPVQKTRILKTKAVDTVVYKKHMYYFCCAGCKPAFLQNPEKYLK
jgi:YHS domain-containing protein